MDKKTVFIKTDKAESEADSLSSDLKRILMLIDNKSTSGELAKRAPPSLRESWVELIKELFADGYIRDRDKQVVEPKIAKPKFNPLKMFTPKPAEEFIPKVTAKPPVDDLDFSNMNAAPVPDAELAAKQKAEAAARERAEMEAAVAAAKARTSAEATAKAEAKARQEAEAAARARAAAEAKAKQEAANREQAEAKAKQETAARMQAQQETARVKVEAEARIRAEIETAARAQQEAEAKGKREAEAARLQVEQATARIKAELEAAERAKADAEARIRAEIETAARAQQEAEAKAKREAEAARLKAEEEAARVKAELAAAARAKAEAEAARLKAEEEAARVKAELAAAKARAEAEAKALAEARAREIAEEKARQEAEARLKAEQEAARIRAEQEAVAKREAEESSTPSSASPPAFEIKLDGFLGTPEPVKQSGSSASRQERAAAEAQARLEAEQRAAAEAKAKSEKDSQKNVAAEMERLKEAADKARRKAEEEAKRKEEEQALAEEQAKAWAEAEHRAKAQAVLEAEQAAQQTALSQAKAKRPSVARKARQPLPLGKISFGLIMLALVVVVVLPYVYPLNEYVAPLEQRLSAQLKQPVHIGAMSASSLPPRLQLQNVTVGSAKEVKIGNVILSFDPFSLFSEIKVIGNAELQEVSIAGSSLIQQTASLQLLGSNAQYPVHHLTLQRVTIVTDEITLPSMSGIADLDAHGAFSRISLHSPDDKLGIDLHNDEGRWQLGVNLKENSLPVLPGVVFSDLSAKGVLGESEVNFTEMDAHIFDGILLGKAKLSWNKGWQLQGSVEAKTFDLGKMFPKLHVEGDMYGEGTFSMNGARLAQMDDTPRLEGTFTVKKGTFNVDMVETARLLSRDNLVGGRTHFDEMSGQVQYENHNSHFRQLKITSEMLDSSGSFEVSSKDQLSGNFSAAIKMRAGSNQLTLYGTPAEPKLRAGR